VFDYWIQPGVLKMGKTMDKPGKAKSFLRRMLWQWLRATCWPGVQLIMALGLGPIQAEESPDSAGQPNLIFILADDLGWGDTGFNGQVNIKTPRLDQLAREGLVFEQFYAGSTVCAPSRATFLTGHHTGNVWQRFNGRIQFREDPFDITIATRLKQAGYRTAMIGKSGLACNSDDPGLPNRKGFDYFFGYLAHEAAHRYFPQSLVRNGEIVHYPNNQGRMGEQYSGDLILADTLQWLDRHAQQAPFFLHLSLQQPHADLVAPEEFVAPYRGQFQDRPFVPPGPNQGYRQVDQPAATYAGMVSYLDHSIGQVIDKLRDLGIAENTLVIFSSDNGGHGEGGANPKYHNSNAPFRGLKRDLYEGGIRVPAVAWWSGTVPAGQRTDLQAAFWDLPATFAELAGLPPLENTDGISFVPTLTGRGGQQKHQFLYWEFHEQMGKQGVRMGDWKGIRLKLQKPQETRFELYDLSSDPAEQINLADQHPEVVFRIIEIMEREHSPHERVSLRTGVR
jgi:arylsulfatase A